MYGDVRVHSIIFVYEGACYLHSGIDRIHKKTKQNKKLLLKSINGGFLKCITNCRVPPKLELYIPFGCPVPGGAGKNLVICKKGIYI